MGARNPERQKNRASGGGRFYFPLAGDVAAARKSLQVNEKLSALLRGPMALNPRLTAWDNCLLAET